MLVSNGKTAGLHMKKNKLIRTLGMGFTAIAVAVSVSLSGIRSEAAPSYLKAATYVSDAWVSNFWNSESRSRQMVLTVLCWWFRGGNFSPGYSRFPTTVTRFGNSTRL